jgi:hypothetical protein
MSNSFSSKGAQASPTSELPKQQQSQAPEPQAPAPLTTNAYAVAAFVLSSVGLAPLAIVCGHRALAEIKRFGGGGRRTAITAVVVSYLLLAVSAAAFAVFLIQLPHLIATLSGLGSGLKSLTGIASLLNPAAAPPPGAPSLSILGPLLGSLGGSPGGALPGSP